MRKALAYPLTVVYYLAFLTSLLVFHAIQWACYYAFGNQAHKWSVNLLNATLIGCLGLIGTKISFSNPHKLRNDKPHIIVCNHQSLYDIPPLIWYLRKIHPKFISKKELGRGIPSVSFNLRHGGSLLIDRNKPNDALVAIQDYATVLNDTNSSTVIFPEGTRAKTSTPKRFRLGGLITLIENMPNAWVLPVSINHSWKLMKWGNFPMMPGVCVRFTVHEPIPVLSEKASDLAARVEQIIVRNVEG
ncbi:MAG: lysophospholipid acyltransferase family protein [Bacteroidota bacterium]|nr:lysophospholipid acyltransferase family protein [Bacteroidota bacterium]